MLRTMSNYIGLDSDFFHIYVLHACGIVCIDLPY